MERRRVALSWLFAAGLAFSSPAAAVVYNVNSTGDTPDDDTADGKCETSTPGVCTLRAAVMQANVTGGTIRLPAITITLTDTIAISHDMSIVGAGMHATVVSGNGLYGIFRVSFGPPYDISISDM